MGRYFKHIWVLLWLWPVLMNAQNYEGMISKGQCDKALTLLNQTLLTAPNDIRSNFFKGRVFASANCNYYQVDSAYACFDKAIKLFGVLKDQAIKEKLYKESITVIIIKNQINNLLNDAYDRVVAQNTLDAYSDFIRRFPESRQAKDAQEAYDQLFLRSKLSGMKTIADFKNFYLQNPYTASRQIIADSLFSKITKKPRFDDIRFFVANFHDHDMYPYMAMYLYRYYRKDGEYLSLLSYYSIVNDLPRDGDQYKDWELAKWAWKLGLCASSAKSGGGCFGAHKNVNPENEELNRRLQREGAKTGDLQFSLMWNNYNDLDLHVIDPKGEEIYYRYRYSTTGGLLDVDMNVYYKTGHYSNAPVENIFWDFGSAPAGHYIVEVVHYLNHGQEGCKDPTPFTVRVRCNGSDTLISSAISYTLMRTPKRLIEFDYSPPEKFTPAFNDSLKVQYDQYIRAAAPMELAWIAVLKLIQEPLQNQDWMGAVKIMAKYSNLFSTDNALMTRIRSLDKLLRDDPYKITREKLTTINTEGEEYSPVPGADDKTLYFCGRDRSGSLGKEDIFVSRLTNGVWGKPALLPNINSAAENEAPLSVSVDGNTLLLFRSGDIYYSNRTASGWSQPTAFPAPVNTAYWEGDAMITADGRTIIFASNRPGGYNMHTEQNYYHGNANYASDIYVCTKLPSGEWGPAVNLGNAVNTPYCERSPFLHPDLKSLYFSSDGHYGLGDLDVFMIRRLSDTSWTSWSKPVNLGKNVNTTEADWGYRVSTSGQWAYFSAIDKEAQTKEDIYRLQLPPELRPEPVIALTGQLTDVRRKNVSAQIHWVNLQTGEDVGVATSDPVTGQYFILLPSGGNYGYYADSGSYFSVSNHLDLTNDSTYRTITQDLSLYRVDDLVASGNPLRINNLFFDYDKSSLRPESFPELNRMAKIIRSHPDIHLEIMGHTDDQGPDDYNLKLSEARAKAVMDYLTSRGVAADRLQAKGYGETKPMLPNNSEANRQMNRRVEFRFFR